MMIKEDEIVYDRDVKKVKEKGKVRIEYEGKRMVEEKVKYKKKKRRMKEKGNVEIVEREGKRIY